MIDGLIQEHAKRNLERVILVSDSDAIQGMISFGEQARQWVEPAIGTLIPPSDPLSTDYLKMQSLG